MQSSKGRDTSADDYELSFATNTLGAFALTRLLEPALKRSPPSRVVFVSSGGMYSGGMRVAYQHVDPVQSRHTEHVRILASLTMHLKCSAPSGAAFVSSSGVCSGEEPAASKSIRFQIERISFQQI